MTRSKDFQNFAKLMISLGTATPKGIPTPETIESYYMLLEDMDFQTVKDNAVYAVRQKGFFPMVSDIRRDQDAQKILEAEANEAYKILETLLERYFWPGMGETFANIVKDKLNEMGKPELLPMLYRWGSEIHNGTNPSATRAQFLKSYISEHGEYGQLSGKRMNEISEQAAKLLNPILEKSEE